MAPHPPPPRISVIVSLYQAERFLRVRLENLVGQSLFQQCEILLYDAASPQREASIAQEFCSRYPNIRYTRLKERLGIYAVWNLGVQQAQSEYITNANADDLLRPDGLETLVHVLDSRPEVDLVYSDYFVTHHAPQSFVQHVRSGYATRPDFSPQIMRYACFMGPMPLWRRSLHTRFGLFDDSLQTAGDYDFWCRCVAAGALFAHYPDFLGLYYHNSGGLCNSHTAQVNQETQTVGTRYKYLLPPTQQHPVYQDFYSLETQYSENHFVNICVITFNRLEFTQKCLESVLRHTRYPYKLTVVDNASQDGTVDYLKDLHFKGVIHNLFLLPTNVGVAKAANIAWHAEPLAMATLKLDNDIVIQKEGWLQAMVETLESVPNIGLLAYNVEPTSYDPVSIQGQVVRIKPKANVGGATVLVPRGTRELLGYWCEDYGLYGEEDADYGARVRLAGLLNVYMEDENALFHLPTGKAAVISHDSLSAADGLEESVDAQYRAWKDAQRRQNLDNPKSAFFRNLEGYQAGWMPLYKPGFTGWSFHQKSAVGPSDYTLIVPLRAANPLWFLSLKLCLEHGGQGLKHTVLVVPQDWQDPNLKQAQLLPHLQFVRCTSGLSRSDFLKAGAQVAPTTWCVVVEPGLVPSLEGCRQLVQTACSTQRSRVQGTVWDRLQILSQPQPWPWFFACRTDLLQRQVESKHSFFNSDIPACLLPLGNGRMKTEG